MRSFLFELSLTVLFVGAVGMVLFGGTVVLATATLQPLDPSLLSTFMSSIALTAAGYFATLLCGRWTLG